MVNASLKFISEVNSVIKKVEAKERRVLYQTGGYAKTTMQRSMKKAKKSKKPTELQVHDSRGLPLYITYQGNVRNQQGRYLPRDNANMIKDKYSPHWKEKTAPASHGGSKPGQPPRYRKKTLRNLMAFEFSKPGEVVAGPKIFKPASKVGAKLIGVKTGAELHEEGGQRTVRRKKGRKKGQQRQKYEPRPFVDPAIPIAANFMAEKMRAIKL